MLVCPVFPSYSGNSVSLNKINLQRSFSSVMFVIFSLKPVLHPVLTLLAVFIS